MTLGRRYLTGVVLVALGAVLVSALVPGAVRVPVAWGGAVGLLLQAPLGWWAC